MSGCSHEIEWDLAGVEARCKTCKTLWPCDRAIWCDGHDRPLRDCTEGCT